MPHAVPPTVAVAADDITATPKPSGSGRRDRYVDAIRALALLVVVLGHWFATAPVVRSDGALAQTEHLLRTWPAASWLTWVLQVVPLFVFVSAAVNAPSLQRSWDAGDTFAHWYRARLRRLVAPTATYLATWLAIAGGIRVGAALGIDGFDGAWRVLGFFSGSLTVHLWFIGMLVATQLLLPLAQLLDRRFGWRSALVILLAAVAVDAVRFTVGDGGPAWGAPNALLVWLVPQQLGILWGQGRIRAPLAAAFLVGGLGGLVAGVRWLGYPVSLVGGDLARNNVLPPTIMIAALALAQAGAVTLAAPLARRALSAAPVWTAVKVLGAIGMPLYLWHKSFEPAVAATLSSWNLVGLVDGTSPADPGFWAGRATWIGLLLLVTVPFALWQLARVRRAAGAPRPSAVVERGDGPALTARIVGASALTVGAIALAMLGGVADLPRLAVAVVGLGLALVLTGRLSPAPTAEGAADVSHAGRRH